MFLFFYLKAPNRPTQSDAFGASTNSGGFADFADFDNKVGSYTVRWDRW